MKILRKTLNKLKPNPQKTKIKQEIKALHRIRLRSLGLLILVWVVGWTSGCAAVVGAAKGAIEGAKLDLQAAQQITRPADHSVTVAPTAALDGGN